MSDGLCCVCICIVLSTMFYFVTHSASVLINTYQECGLLQGHHVAMFSSSGACFYTTFLKKCGRGYGFRTAMCALPHVLELLVGVSKGTFPVKYFCPWNALVADGFYGVDCNATNLT